MDLEQAEAAEPGSAGAPGTPAWVAVLEIPVSRGLVPVPVCRVSGWAVAPGNPGWVAVRWSPGFQVPELSARVPSDPELVVVLEIPEWTEQVPGCWVPGCWVLGCWVLGWVVVAGNSGRQVLVLLSPELVVALGIPG
ncbi:hypothetical protein ACQPXH_25825 [Nocardia sp. CA-135953]|uniref:hypothetical protein n=1 Tax=Nocardia sp. CA-135953 TaxID=3239978 RepID=UPI003D978A4F